MSRASIIRPLPSTGRARYGNHHAGAHDRRLPPNRGQSEGAGRADRQDPLAEGILAGAIHDGETVTIGADAAGLVIDKRSVSAAFARDAAARLP
jgi:hypothetical protein